MSKYIQSEIGLMEKEKKQMVFLIPIIKKSKPYLNYGDDKLKDLNIPQLLMFNRWDGKYGFIGGNVDNTDKSLLGALHRECLEEINFNINDYIITNKIKPFRTYSTEKCNIHSYLLELEEIDIKDIFVQSANAKHFLAEGTLSVHQIYKDSINNLLKAEFSGSAKLEFLELIKELENENLIL